MSPTTYQVEARQVGNLWHLEVPHIGSVTQAKHHSEIQMMARDLISIITGEPAETITVTVTHHQEGNK